MSGIATAIVGSAIIGGVASNMAANKAASAQSKSAASAIDEQQRQYDLTRSDLAPYRNIGYQALGTLGSLYGYNAANSSGPLSYEDWAKQNQSAPSMSGPWGNFGNYFAYQNYVQNFKPQAATAPDYSAFFKSPDYEFRRSEGLRGVEQSAAARGGAYSGNALKALADYNSNLAAGEFGNYFNRQAVLAGIGQSATNTSATAGQASANNIGNMLMAQGDARASGIMGAANGWSSALNSGLNNYMLYKGGWFTRPTAPASGGN